jgi:hypothetical protein
MNESTNNRDVWLAQIEKHVKAKVGDQWRSRRWSEFVKDVAWWLHIEKERDDEDTIDAAAGLIVYGIRGKQDLINVADNKKDFSNRLEPKVVLPAICDSLFNKYVAPAQQISTRVETEDRFEQAKQQQKYIFSDGLPELGPLSETTKFTSNPSIPTEEQHATASLQIATFSILSDLEELPCPKTNIWNHVISETDTLGGYSNEADVNSHVKMVIEDILEALGIRGKVTIRAEVEVMRNRPDFMLILVNGHPIGMIKCKQPGKDAMEHPNILGEVYDQLMHLHSIFRVNTPFAILTCYEKWRICWLCKNDSIEIAGMGKLPKPSLYQTPVKQTQECINTFEGNLGDKPPPPQLPPTPSLKRGFGLLQEVDDAESDVVEDKLDMDDEMIRRFCGTTVMEWDDRSLPAILASVIKKMMLARQGAEPTVLRLTNETTSAWKKAPQQASLNFDRCLSGAVKNFYFWEDLGHGADGRAFLVSGGTRGAVGVLKFFFQDPEAKAQYEEKMWKAVYSHLPPVANTVRIVKVMGQTALLMPWFQCPKRTQLELDAVQKTLSEDFKNKGMRHEDIAWRNVGLYHGDNGELQAVVFDMQKVCYVANQEEDWVQPAITSLSQKLIH